MSALVRNGVITYDDAVAAQPLPRRSRPPAAGDGGCAGMKFGELPPR
ncbi:hypothetical protein ACFQX7_26885 [Luedemannella flava]